SVGVTGCHVHHSVDDSGARTVQSSAMSLESIGSVVWADGIKIPQNFAIACVIRPHVPIERTREHHAGNGRGRRHLRRTATKRSYARGFGWSRDPYLLSCTEVESEYSSAEQGIVGVPIGERVVRSMRISRASPLNSAERSAFADARVPKELAVMIWIERVNDSGLLRQQENVFSVSASLQDRRSTEVEVAPAILRAVVFLLGDAGAVPQIFRSEL